MDSPLAAQVRQLPTDLRLLNAGKNCEALGMGYNRQAGAAQEAWEGILNDGFVLLRGVFSASECRAIGMQLDAALAASADPSVLRRANGAIYGARNLLSVFPLAASLWRKPALEELLTTVLGVNCGQVRGLCFDKPPESTWSLPWHQDLTIAVSDHSLPSEQFRNRTVKAGVPHVEASDELLRQMLTLRIQLDDVTEENGPLQVLPGTHAARDAAAVRPAVMILGSAGDVLAMRPLLSHCSGVSAPGTKSRRRVIHLEFAASGELPDGYTWQTFIPLSGRGTLRNMATLPTAM